MTVMLRPDQHRLVDWIYRNGAVVSRKDHDDGSVSLTLSVTDATQREIETKLSKEDRD